MKCKFITEELKLFPYPNLEAEWMESPYSVETIADYLGISRGENCEQEVLKRMCGGEVSTLEAVKLANLFNADLYYLFDENLRTICGKPVAHIRWELMNNIPFKAR